jgi:copper(I)-binding protein
MSRSTLLPFRPRAVATPRDRPLLGLAVAGVAAVLLAGCGGGSSADTSAAAPTSAAAEAGSSVAAAAESDADAGVTLQDAWVKAAPDGMTAIFGTLDNPTDADVTVESASSGAAGMVELHEVAMVDGEAKMQPKAGGFVVPAHGTHDLKPGGDHIMLMGLKQAVRPGDTVTAVLSLSGGASVEVQAIAKDFAAGNESYAGASPAAS